MRQFYFKRYIISILLVTILFSISSFALCDEVTYTQEYKISIDNSASHEVNFNFSNIHNLDNLSYIKSKDLYYMVNDTKIKNGEKIRFAIHSLYPKFTKTFEHVDNNYSIPWETITYDSLRRFDNYSEYLNSDVYYDYNSEPVQSVSTSIGLSKNNSAVENITLISQHLINHMTYDMSHLGMTKASDVAQSMSGVCSDYTTLTVALLRSVDIPARGVSGVRYDKDIPVSEIPSNAQHMWTEINIDGTWYILDTTLTIRGDYQSDIKQLLDSITKTSFYLPIGEINNAGSHKLSVNLSTQSTNARLSILDNGYFVTENEIFTPEVERPKDNYIRFDETHWASERAIALHEKYDLSTDLNDFDLNRNITRLESAKLIEKLTSHLEDGQTSFPDIDDQIVGKLAYNDIIKGYPDGEFKPHQTITRESFFYLLGTLFSKYNYPLLSEGNDFTDLSHDHWSRDHIHSVTRRLEITGYPDGTFKPKNNITLGEALFIISKAEQLKTVLDL